MCQLEKTHASRKEKNFFNRTQKGGWRFLPCLKTEVSAPEFYDYEVNIEASTFQSFVKQVIEKAEAFNPEAELYRHLDDHKLNFDEIVDEIMRADEAFGRLADRFRRLLRRSSSRSRR